MQPLLSNPDEQETPLSASEGRDPFMVGFGVGWITQVDPSHLSARVFEMGKNTLPEAIDPTAVQAFSDAHDTPFRSLPVEPFGVGVAWIIHVDPFQRSASGTSMLEEFS
ncbi:MAG TPA: hypothetical protein VKR21_03515 [Solirubrobacteraceae bacterium]|nr:hypothetical protein [Solirubrobacteraceae bacterium]